MWDGVVFFLFFFLATLNIVSKSLKEMHEGCQFLLSVPKVQLY